MPRHLSGIQPSGLLHLGNYFGAMRQHIAVSKTADPHAKDALFFIADLHALTTTHDRAKLALQVKAIAASYIALGLDTDRAVFFRQSDVPEVAELMWLLSCVTGMGLLQRAHSFKDKVDKGISASVGLFTYPVLMAADIVIYDSDVVPVGQDQVQHVEMAQDMVTHFNTAFGGEHLRRPEWKLSPTPKVPGTDGAKMSKSYGNTIWIFEEGKALKKAVNGIVTDSRAPEEPKDPDTLNAYAILELFLDDAEREDWRRRLTAGGVGYGHLKGAIAEKMESHFGPARARYQQLMGTPSGNQELEAVLAAGAHKARVLAQATLERCMRAAGLLSRADSLAGGVG